MFPGESDVDQLFHILKCFGRLTDRQMELLKDNPLFVGVKLPHYEELETLDKRFPDVEAQQVRSLTSHAREI